MNTFNSFNALAAGQSVHSNMSLSQASTFNAEFAGVEYLTPEQHKQCYPYMDAVLEAEKAYRAKRLTASEFEKRKASLEAPLKEHGVTVAWEEPKGGVTRPSEVY